MGVCWVTWNYSVTQTLQKKVVLCLLFIESQDCVFFLLFPFIFLLIAMTMLQPWTSQTGQTAASGNTDDFGESAILVSFTYACLGERGGVLFVGSWAWWKLSLLLGCWFCRSNRQSLLNFNSFFDGVCFFFLILYYCWRRWINMQWINLK